MISETKARVVTLTYSNVRKNKDGKWIGTRMTVDRSVNDIIPVDTALNDSMLNCSKQSDNIGNEEDDTEGNKRNNEGLINDTVEREEANKENREHNTEEIEQLRRSERVRKQRYKVNSYDIGDDKNDLDEDYIPEA